MGTPLYPKTFGDELRDLKRGVNDTFTSANSKLPTRLISPHVNIDNQGLHILDNDNNEIIRLGVSPDDDGNGLYVFDPVNDTWTTANLSLLGKKADFVHTRDSRSTNSFGDIGTYGPEVDVTIGQSGTALVTLSAYMEWTTPYNNASRINGAMMGFEVRDYNTNSIVLPAADARSLIAAIGYDMQPSGTSNFDIDAVKSQSFVYYAHGLTPGRYYFTAKYCSNGPSAITSFYSERLLAVEPI